MNDIEPVEMEVLDDYEQRQFHISRDAKRSRKTHRSNVDNGI